MESKIVKKMVQVGNKVEVILTTGDQISGLLTEIGTDHITIDGKMAISVEAVIGVQSLDSSTAQDSSSNTPSNPPNLDNKVDTPTPLESGPNEIETPEHDKPLPSEGEVPNLSDVNTVSVDTIPKAILTPESSGVETESTNSVDSGEPASEKMVEIENRFNTEIQTVKLEFEPPDLKFPAKELPGWNTTSAAGDWLGIKRQYEAAQKANELSPNDDTIQQIVDKLKSLVKMYPNSLTLKRSLGYFYSILDNWDETLHNYQDAAIQSEKAHDYDWFNIAVSALKLEKEELACYSLGKFFSEVTPVAEAQAWNVYVNLIEKFNNLSAFRELCKPDRYIMEEEEIRVLLEAAIYLLKKNDEALALEIMQKWLTGESENSLLTEACEKLDGQSTKSYRQFLTQFMNTTIALEKKSDPITPERPKSTSGAKPSISQSTQQKQKRQTHGWFGNLYREAERANIREKDLEKAERLYGECMEQNIHFESALKDRAMVLARLERYEEAESLLLLEDNREKAKDKQSVDRLLLNIYQKWGQHQKAINLLNDLFQQTQDMEKSTDIQWQIAITHLKLEDYVNAEAKFRQVQEQRPDNITVKRNIAVCLSKQPKPRYDDAEKILNEIQNTSPNVKTAELLEAIKRAKVTGEFSLNEDNSKEFLSDFSFSGDASGFAQFFLKRCNFHAVRPERIIDEIDGKKYDPPSQRLAVDDMKQLAETADDPKQIGPTRPVQRTAYLLSAARICDMGFGDRNDFYRYLCSCFTSRGDVALTEDLNTAQAWYREALIAYDKYDKTALSDIAENDARGSLVRYLYAIYLPSTKIPKPPRTLPLIADAVKSTIENCINKEKVFDAIAYLVSHSQYATQQILKVLYENSILQAQAIAYLKKMKILVPPTIDSQDVFSQLWKSLENKNDERVREISNALRLLNDFELSQAWLRGSIEIAQHLHEKLLFELDEKRIRDLLIILETAHDLCGRSGFEERDRLCEDLKRDCQNLLEEIERKPTNLSIKYVYSIIEIIQEKVNLYSEELHDSSKPELDLRLAEESPPLGENGTIEIQIVVENEEGRMPAENLKLIPELDTALLKEKAQDIELGEPLYGGKEGQKIRVFHLHLTEYAIRQEVFSFRVRAEYIIPEYIIPGGEEDEKVKDFTINLGSKDKFKTIDNPYAAYAKGNEVENKKMFFGREELIKNIASDIQQSVPQSKCVLVYGQYRSGKSSVRLHLKERLDKDNTLLVADLKDILLNMDAKRSVLCQILIRILSALRETVKNRVNNNDNFGHLSYAIPSDEELENHSDPQHYFEEIISNFKNVVRNEWGVQQVVLLIDEFQHIYEIMITTDKLSSDFMRTWKGFLQRNLFSAVLVGQQVMAKFDERFPNEFAGMQHQKVSYLTEEDAKLLIEKPILIGGDGGRSRYRERAVEQILKLTACSPYYIQIICDLLVKHMNNRRIPWVTEADVQFVTKAFIDASSDEGISHIFTDSGDRSEDRIPKDEVLKVLRAIAENSQANGCLRNHIDCETSRPVDDILDELVTRDVLKRNQVRYYEIKVGLFKEWLIS